MRISDAMEELAEDLAAYSDDAAEAEAEYKVKFAKARLKARAAGGSGPQGRTTNDEADDRAIEACEVELRRYIITESLAHAARDALRAKQTQLDGLRSVNANVRYSAGLS